VRSSSWKAERGLQRLRVNALQLSRECRGDVVRFHEAGKQFFRDTSAVNASEAKGSRGERQRQSELAGLRPPSYPNMGTFQCSGGSAAL